MLDFLNAPKTRLSRMAKAAAKSIDGYARRVWTYVEDQIDSRGRHDGVRFHVMRGHRRERSLRWGRNMVHAMITHPDGTLTDLGLSENLMTNIGNMVIQSLAGQIPSPAAAGTPATAISSTSVTVTGTPLTASNLAGPTLGLVGLRVYMPLTNITTPPVYGNIISNTTSVITVDQWWTSADGQATTPASTNALLVAAGGLCGLRFMGLTTDAAAASATDTVLASEQTTGGAARALATFARGSNPSGGSGTFTLQKAFSITATIASLQKMGLFVSLTDGSGTTAAHGGPVCFETVFTAASVANGDTLTVTDTITVSG